MVLVIFRPSRKYFYSRVLSQFLYFCWHAILVTALLCVELLTHALPIFSCRDRLLLNAFRFTSSHKNQEQEQALVNLPTCKAWALVGRGGRSSEDMLPWKFLKNQMPITCIFSYSLKSMKEPLDRWSLYTKFVSFVLLFFLLKVASTKNWLWEAHLPFMVYVRKVIWLEGNRDQLWRPRAEKSLFTSDVFQIFPNKRMKPKDEFGILWIIPNENTKNGERKPAAFWHSRPLVNNHELQEIKTQLFLLKFNTQVPFGSSQVWSISVVGCLRSGTQVRQFGRKSNALDILRV